MRLEVTKKTDLAFRAFAHLKEAGGSSTGPSTAAAIETTTAYLPQVLKPLVAAGWLASTPGPGGGYRLATPLDQISVLNVIEQVEGKTRDDRCVLRGTPCPAQEQCVLHTSWVQARSALLAELDATSLEAALASGS